MAPKKPLSTVPLVSCSVLIKLTRRKAVGLAGRPLGNLLTPSLHGVPKMRMRNSTGQQSSLRYNLCDYLGYLSDNGDDFMGHDALYDWPGKNCGAE